MGIKGIEPGSRTGPYTGLMLYTVNVSAACVGLCMRMSVHMY